MPGRGKKNWLIAAAILAALVVAGAARLHTLVSIAGDRWPAERKPDSLVAQIAALRGKIASVAGSGPDWRLAERLLPRDADAAAVLRALGDAAAATGVELGKVAARDGEEITAGWHPLDGGPTLALAVEIGAAGSYDALALFVNALEGGHPEYADRLFVIESLDFRKGRDGRHNAEILAQTFALPEAAGRDTANDNWLETPDLATTFERQGFSYPPGGKDPMNEPGREKRLLTVEVEQGQRTSSELPGGVNDAAVPSVKPELAVIPPDFLGDRLAADLDVMRQAMAEGNFELAERLAEQALAGPDTEVIGGITERARKLRDEIAQLRRLAFLERENAVRSLPAPEPLSDPLADRLAADLAVMRQVMAEENFELAERLAAQTLTVFDTHAAEGVSERAERLRGQIAQLRRLAFLERENAVRSLPAPEPIADPFADRLAADLAVMRQTMAEGNYELAERLAAQTLTVFDTHAAEGVSERAERLRGQIAQLRRLAFLERENSVKTLPAPEPTPDPLADRLAADLDVMRQAMAEGNFELAERLATQTLAELDTHAAGKASMQVERLRDAVARLRRLAFLERENAANILAKSEPEALTVRLDGIAWSEDDPRVIVGGMAFGVGETLPAAPGAPALTVAEILPDEVVFLFRGEKIARKVGLFGKKDF